ncbi:MAG: cation:proton antiporter, partial [Nanoarchaeota archaeon]
MESLILTLVICFIALTIMPIFMKKFGMPVIVAEIIFGILIGKSFLDIVPQGDSTIEFFSAFGLSYLMFLAGLEVRFAGMGTNFHKTASLAFFSVSIPFISGALLARSAGVHPLLLGTIFCTTSLGIILPMTKELRYNRNFLDTLLSSVILVDIISMFLLAFSLSYIQGALGLSFVYSLAVIVLMFIIPWILHKKDLKVKIERWLLDKSHFEVELRFAFALILIFGAISDKLGFHSIIGAFIAGLIISRLTPRASLFYQKLEGFGYGFFIPLFFIFIGAKVDLPALFSNLTNVTLLITIIIVAILSKILGAGLIAKLKHFTIKESFSLG